VYTRDLQIPETPPAKEDYSMENDRSFLNDACIDPALLRELARAAVGTQKRQD
jgi:hypothetical protein